MLKTQKAKLVSVQDWDELVKKTYGKPYSFQQQNGCMERGTYPLTVPPPYTCDEDMYDSIPEKVNGDKMGVKFATWLARDPKEPLKDEKDKDNDRQQWVINLFWERNFYPSIEVLADDLYKRGLVEAGEYVIDIDW